MMLRVNNKTELGANDRALLEFAQHLPLVTNVVFTVTDDSEILEKGLAESDGDDNSYFIDSEIARSEEWLLQNKTKLCKLIQDCRSVKALETKKDKGELFSDVLQEVIAIHFTQIPTDAIYKLIVQLGEEMICG